MSFFPWLEFDTGQIAFATAALWTFLCVVLGVLGCFKREGYEQVRAAVLAQLHLAAQRGLPLVPALHALGTDLQKQGVYAPSSPGRLVMAMVIPPYGAYLVFLLLMTDARSLGERGPRSRYRMLLAVVFPPFGLYAVCTGLARWLIRRRRHMESVLVWDIAAGLQEGQLGPALRSAKAAFPEPLPTLLDEAHRRGALTETLAELQRVGALQERFRGELRSRLTYPLVILTGVELVALFVLTVCFPRLQLQTAIGGPTAMAFVSWLPWLLIVGAPLVLFALWLGAGVIGGRGLASPSLRRWLPFAAHSERIAARVLLGRQLAALLRAGVPLPDGLRALETLGQGPGWDLERAARLAEEGASAASALAQAGALPKDALARLAHGAGSAEHALEAVAEQAEAELRRRMDTLSMASTPLAILTVGTLVASVYIPVLTTLQRTTSAFLW